MKNNIEEIMNDFDINQEKVKTSFSNIHDFNMDEQFLNLREIFKQVVEKTRAKIYIVGNPAFFINKNTGEPIEDGDESLIEVKTVLTRKVKSDIVVDDILTEFDKYNIVYVYSMLFSRVAIISDSSDSEIDVMDIVTFKPIKVKGYCSISIMIRYCV